MLREVDDVHGITAGAEAPEGTPEETSAEREGRFIGFGYVPVTAEAKAAVAELVGMVVEHERATGKPVLRGPERLGILEDAAGRFVADLALGVDKGELLPQPCPKDAGRITREYPVTYRPFRAVYDAFRDRRPPLIEEATKGSSSKGRVGTARPLPALVAVLRRHGIAEGKAREHFRWGGRTVPLIKRAGSAWSASGKKQGKSLPVENTEQTRRLRQEVDALNLFVRDLRLEGVTDLDFAGWSRGFSEADHVDFDWNRGGRLIAQPGGSYQQLPEEDRLRLTINGRAGRRDRHQGEPPDARLRLPRPVLGRPVRGHGDRRSLQRPRHATGGGQGVRDRDVREEQDARGMA